MQPLAKGVYLDASGGDHNSRYQTPPDSPQRPQPAVLEHPTPHLVLASSAKQVAQQQLSADVVAVGNGASFSLVMNNSPRPLSPPNECGVDKGDDGGRRQPRSQDATPGIPSVAIPLVHPSQQPQRNSTDQQRNSTDSPPLSQRQCTTTQLAAEEPQPRRARPASAHPDSRAAALKAAGQRRLAFAARGSERPQSAGLRRTGAFPDHP